MELPVSVLCFFFFNKDNFKKFHWNFQFNKLSS